jgi:hypothetical protein
MGIYLKSIQVVTVMAAFWAVGCQHRSMLFTSVDSFDGFRLKLEKRWSPQAAQRYIETHKKHEPFMQRPVVFMCSNWLGFLHEPISQDGYIFWEAIVIRKSIRAYAVIYRKGEDLWILEEYEDAELPWYDSRKLQQMIDEGGDGQIDRTRKAGPKPKEPNQSP